jgi:hypothetical protein
MDSLARYHAGQASLYPEWPCVAPFHRCAGVPAWGAAAHATLHQKLGLAKQSMARTRALANREPMPLATAAASLKSIVVGARDGGLAAAALTAQKFSSTLIADANTDSLLNAEETVAQLIAEKVLRRGNVRLRTSPQAPFPAAHASSRDSGRATRALAADDDYHSNFDVAVFAAPVAPLLPDVLLDDATAAARYGTSSKASCVDFDGKVASRLRPSGGHVVFMVNNLFGLSRGTNELAAGADLRMVLRDVHVGGTKDRALNNATVAHLFDC